MSSKNRVNSGVFLPVPVRGVDYRVPIFEMPAQYSPWMFNVRLVSGLAKIRPPHTQEIIGSTASALSGCIVSGSLVVGIQSGVAGTVSNVPATSTTPADVTPESFDYTEFRDRLFVTADGDTYELNKTTMVWTSVFTHAETNAGNRKPIASYRERLYMGCGKILHYGNLGAITGVWNTTDLDNLINGNICAIAPLSLSAAFSPQSFLCVATTAGEILVFAGANPADPDWVLVNTIKLDVTPISGKGTIQFVQVPNDVIVNVRTSPLSYSLRSLITNGIGSQEEALNSQVYQLFQQSPGTQFFKSVAYVLNENMLVTRYDIRTPPSIIQAWVDAGYWPYLGSTDITLLTTYDFGDQSFLLHSSPVLNTNPGSFTAANTINDLRANSGYAFSPARNGVAQLFDDSSSSAFNIDSAFNSLTPGTEVIYLVMSFPALGLQQGGYRNKKFQFMAVYSNTATVTNPNLGFQVAKNFTQGLTSFQTFVSEQTVNAIYRDVLMLTEFANTGIITLQSNGGSSTTTVANAKTFYGVDLIVEEGGEF
jgi:hypothetical protein